MSCRSSEDNRIYGPEGLISSLLTDKKGCGSRRAPWVITADPGHTIAISIVDFNVDEMTQNFISCRHVYGHIQERALGINYTICGGVSRQMSLYTSKTNTVRIIISPKTYRKEGSFLLRYKGEQGLKCTLLLSLCLC